MTNQATEMNSEKVKMEDRTNNEIISTQASAQPPDFISMDFTGEASMEEFRGDGSVWKFNRDTVERDITAFELLFILNMTMSLCDGVMGGIKAEPHLLRHFKRLSAATSG